MRIKTIRYMLAAVLCMAAMLFTYADSSRLYTAESGLSSSKITCLTQDHYGFLWVGTEYGLNRFDGYRYTSYFYQANDTTSLPSGEVTAFLSDREGRLWVGCNKGLARYRHETDDFERYSFGGSVLPRVESIVETRHGDILVGTAGYGLYVIRHGTRVLEKLRNYTRTNADEFASRIYEDSLRHLWRGSHQPRLVRMSLSDQLEPSDFRDHDLGQAGPVVQYIGTRARILIICMYDILSYDFRTDRISRAGYDLSDLGRKASIRTAALTRDGALYLGTSGRGVFVAPRGQKTFTQLARHTTQLDLSKANVNALLEDKDGNLWVSCYNKGLFQLSTARTTFFTQTFADQDIRLGSSVSSIAPASDGGKWLTVQKSGIYHLSRDGRVTEQRTQPEGANTIYRDTRGDYWLGTENALYRYDVGTGVAQKALDMDGWGVNCMVDCGDGRLAVSNFGKGLVIYDTRTGSHSDHSMTERREGRLPNDWIKAMIHSSLGHLWLATADGLAVADATETSFTTVKSFNGRQCLSLCELHNHDILVGTDQGLYLVSIRNRRAEPFPGSEELGGVSVYGIVEDRAGDIWLSTAMGIWQFDQRQHRWLGHIGGSGLLSREYVVGAALHDDQTDAVAFGIGDGITTFLPDVVRQSAKHVGTPHLSRMVYGGRERGFVDNRYDVDYQDNTLTLDFSLLNFRDIDNVTYEYRLSDHDAWTTISDGGNQLTLTKMEPGTYRLEVRATNGGTHSAQPLVLTIRVRHPWYTSPLAWVAYVFLAIAIAVLVLYYIDRRRKVQTEEAKMRFLINATHDIRSPLTLILGPLAKLKQRLKDAESQDDIDTIDRNAQRLLLLVNQILDERRIDKQQMRLHCQETDLITQVAGVCSMYQYNAHQRHITFAIDHDMQQLHAWIDRTQFDKVLANLLSNAFKYTLDGGEIRFALEKTATEAVVRLTDSGPGLREDKPDHLFERFYQGRNAQTLHVEGTGIGLNLSRAIVLLHGGTITAYNRQDGQTGAVFEVRLPLGKAHLNAEQIEAPEPADTSKASTGARGQRVLIVDDDHELASYVAAELSPWFRTETLADGRAALKALLRDPERYDLVISDVVMPEMDGLELLRNVKTNPRLSDIPVILLTSKSEADHRVEGLKKGADGYIAKPFSMEELRAMAGNVIDNVQRLRGKFSGAQQQEERREHLEVKGNDDALMERIMKSLNAHLSDPEFRVDSLTQDVGISRAQLHRKLKEITGLPAGEFIRNLRLDEAARLLREGQLSVTQVTYAVGFSSQSHFSTLFHKRFGVSPKEYYRTDDLKDSQMD